MCLSVWRTYKKISGIHVDIVFSDYLKMKRHENYHGAPKDGSAWDDADTGAARVLRGGCWNFRARRCRSAFRDFSVPDFRDYLLGFRRARVRS